MKMTNQFFFFPLGNGMASGVETDVQRYDRINYQTIPNYLWDIIPDHGKYLIEIMKFSGYRNRASIFKLKDREEMKKMVAFAADHSYLIDEKD